MDVEDTTGIIQQGNYGEMYLDYIMESNFGKRIGGHNRVRDLDKTAVGIDGIYRNPNPLDPQRYIVAEVKTSSKSIDKLGRLTASKVGLKRAGDCVQMSDEWIKARLKKAVIDTSLSGKAAEQAEKIYQDILTNGYKTIMVRMGPNGEKVVLECISNGAIDVTVKVIGKL